MIKRFDFPTKSFSDSSFFNSLSKKDSYLIFHDETPDKPAFLRLHLIGKGSNIFLGLHLETFSIVVLKPINENSQKSIERERTIAQLRIRHCVHYYGEYSSHQNQYFVLDFMSKGTLDEQQTKLMNQQHSKKKKLFSLLDLIKGINTIHKKGLIHHDISPLNILMDHDQGFCLCDFEHTRTIGGEPYTSDVGQYLYSAPSLQSNDSDNISYSVDIYSFGLLIPLFFNSEILEQLDIRKHIQYKCIEKSNEIISSETIIILLYYQILA
ncbi:hypothetical protein TRFO_26812 [Tritrichomonas foetus]|uniref:non-specific serine/threonine protein kinase n=1 Tax=Tritrichomonas foetus TaxID=1144522 RepID=A0A1J4K6W9_9EUKA|nr:hypothetical protein TRFO_26812 [Tritrichomonas foetus]|eukprot:OHT05462.1 hypothetical protein TRFO_26812 [Tritrichomonas foetus]